jgi:hypothetical protein
MWKESVKIVYTAKKRSGWCNIDENRIEQCFAAHIVHSCQQYWTMLLHPIQAQQYCSILLTSVNNVGRAKHCSILLSSGLGVFCRVGAVYTRKNAQVVAVLMKTGLNNVLLPKLFTVVNNIEQYCYTRFRLNNTVQYCWQVWTTWAAKHCSILLSSGLGVFCRV